MAPTVVFPTSKSGRGSGDAAPPRSDRNSGTADRRTSAVRELQNMSATTLGVVAPRPWLRSNVMCSWALSAA